MVDPYWNLGPLKEIEFAKKQFAENPELATPKQLGLVRWMTRKLKMSSYPGIENNKRLCSAFINALMDYEHFLTFDDTTKEHIRRVWRGELKHDKGTPENPLPWD